MIAAIISKNWLRSFVSKSDTNEGELYTDGPSIEGEEIVDNRELSGASTEFDQDDDEAESLPPRSRLIQPPAQLSKQGVTAGDEAVSSEEPIEGETVSEGEEDPFAQEIFDLERGEPLEEDEKSCLPWQSKVESTKEFFQSEILYRFDVLSDTLREALKGSYRIELKGNQGGIWTLNVGQQLDVVNRREEAEVILSMQNRDFLQIVNGELNPQLAILSQKTKITGDVRRAIDFQSLLCPVVE
ncbi:SCP2 sterol-binding domain-containing protein [bacterium]|nr:SCP2 sterol-binding domain-containing protein [bacterium]